MSGGGLESDRVRKRERKTEEGGGGEKALCKYSTIDKYVLHFYCNCILSLTLFLNFDF